jgi:hypothetical protein
VLAIVRSETALLKSTRPSNPLSTYILVQEILAQNNGSFVAAYRAGTRHAWGHPKAEPVIAAGHRNQGVRSNAGCNLKASFCRRNAAVK